MSLPGIIAIIGATMIWGVSGIYFTLIADVPALEIVAHRTVWSLVFFLVIFAVQGRLGEFLAVWRDRRLLLRVFFGAAMVSANWFFFVLAIQTGRATEASLGYFMLPLMTAALAALVLKEVFTTAQKIAVGFAVIAVIVLTAGLGVVPWISLLLGATFALYALFKKRLELGPMLSVAVEVAMVGPILMAWVMWQNGGVGAFGVSSVHALWLIGFAFFTGFPLMLFSFGSRRLPLLTVGLVTYVNPTMQFLVAILYFREPITWPHMVAFPLIWLGLALHTWDAFRQERSRKAAIRAGTSATLL